MTRLRRGFLNGEIDDDPLTSGATTLTSSELADLPVISSPDYMVLILDPTGSAGAPEIVYVTAHTSSATSATISRGKENTSAREHAQDIAWIHGPTTADYVWGLLGYTQKDSDDLDNDITNNTTVDIITLTTDVPVGERLLKVEFFCLVRLTTGNGQQNFNFEIEEDSTVVASYFMEFEDNNHNYTVPINISLIREITGGSSHTYTIRANASTNAADGVAIDTTIGAYPVHLALIDLGAN